MRATFYKELDWWSSVSISITRPALDSAEVSQLLQSLPRIVQRLGEANGSYGQCRWAGHWCVEHRVEAPDLPTLSFLWAEEFSRSHEAELSQLLKIGCRVGINVAV